MSLACWVLHNQNSLVYLLLAWFSRRPDNFRRDIIAGPHVNHLHIFASKIDGNLGKAWTMDCIGHIAMPNLMISGHLLSQMPFISSQTHKKTFAKGKFSSEAKIAIKFSLATTSCTVRIQYRYSKSEKSKKFLNYIALELIYIWSLFLFNEA